jgi:hypothetical protein
MTRPRSLAQYLLNVAVAVDQLANALIAGDPHATISSRAYLATLRGKRWGCVLCRLLDRIQPDHCKIAWSVEIAADHARLAAEEGA